MEGSILTTIKKMLGIAEEYDHFDTDIISHINSVLSVLTQLGVGPEDGFSIQDKSVTWHDFMGDDKRLDLVQSYMVAKVRLLFDPPLSSAVMEASKQIISEFEWRIMVAAEQSQNKVEEGTE